LNPINLKRTKEAFWLSLEIVPLQMLFIRRYSIQMHLWTIALQNWLRKLSCALT